MGDLKGVLRPPFATYDVVVYFGAGLFLIPFLNRYIFEPFELKWPSFRVGLEEGFAAEAVSFLAMLFTIYIVGHLLAYVSSQVIEKLFNRVLGKVSSAILVAVESQNATRNAKIRLRIRHHISRIGRDKSVISTSIRGLPHLPFLPVYIVIYFLGIFGYYDTRVSSPVIAAANEKISKLGIPSVSISLNIKWYKILEYYVINRSQFSASRMYNYLVISGLFRSISLIFLFAVWCQIYYLMHYWWDGHWRLGSFLGANGNFRGLWELGLTAMVFIFSVFSFLKFNAAMPKRPYSHSCSMRQRP